MNDGKVAHGETIYNTASVAKVIGGTLAGKLEAEDRLHDGTTFSLDLTKRDRVLPHQCADRRRQIRHDPVSQHKQNVDQLLSHLGCIAHYETTPISPIRRQHYANAIAAVQSIWNVGLVNGCTIGSTISYSTPAFTFVGAVLERVTGRTAAGCCARRSPNATALPTLRVQFETAVAAGELRPGRRPTTTTTPRPTYQDNSWKPLERGNGAERRRSRRRSAGRC